MTTERGHHTPGSDDGDRDVDAQVLEFFEGTVDEEWERMQATLADRVSHELHLAMLQRQVREGDRVLEIGSGAGRYSLALAEAGARVTVTDISPAQLEGARTKLAEHGLDGQVERFEVVDVRDLSRYREGSFDAVCAYGGPLSYTFDRAPQALAEISRVLVPGGTLVASVMSNAGSARAFGGNFAKLVRGAGLEAVGEVVASGDLRPVQPEGHTCKMYYADELAALVHASPFELVEISASSWLATGSPVELAEMCSSAEVWAAFVDWEASMAQRSGCLDGGTHILFAARTP